MFWTSAGVKPVSRAVTSYLPGRRPTNRYAPVASLTAVAATAPVARLLASTVTPGSTAPDVSFTMPTIEPVCSCASAGIDSASTHARA